MWYGPNQWQRHRPHRSPYGYGIPWVIIVVIIGYLVLQFWWVILVGAIVTMIIYSAIKNANQPQNTGQNFQQTYYQPPKQNTVTGSATSTQSYSSYQPQPPQYQPYGQGYKPNQTVYQQKVQQQSAQFQHEEQEQKPESVYDEYDQPKAEYPQQMPPM